MGKDKKPELKDDQKEEAIRKAVKALGEEKANVAGVLEMLKTEYSGEIVVAPRTVGKIREELGFRPLSGAAKSKSNKSNDSADTFAVLRKAKTFATENGMKLSEVLKLCEGLNEIGGSGVVAEVLKEAEQLAKMFNE